MSEWPLIESLAQAAEHLRQLGLEVTVGEDSLSAMGGRVKSHPMLDETDGDSFEFWSNVRFVSNTWIVRHQARARPDRATSLANAVALITALFEDYKQRAAKRRVPSVDQRG